MMALTESRLDEILVMGSASGSQPKGKEAAITPN
jgi:hypothetical protein